MTTLLVPELSSPCRLGHPQENKAAHLDCVLDGSACSQHCRQPVEPVRSASCFHTHPPPPVYQTGARAKKYGTICPKSRILLIRLANFYIQM
jgi:hypothetical protein